eukprot:m.151510 g.151510  ORF g.151510 m.151510 type:complete len:668 (-) comp17413_c0_seq2:218-2221(-)
MTLHDDPGSGVCERFLRHSVGGHPGLSVAGLSSSAILVVSMVGVVVLLARAYRQSYNRDRRPVRSMLRTSGPPPWKRRVASAMVLPKYYYAAQLLVLLFVVQTFAWLSPPNDTLFDTIQHVVFAVCMFCDLVLVVHMSLPVSTSLWVSAALSGVVAVGMFLVVQLLGTPTDCPWCGIHFPRPGIEYAFVVLAALFLFTGVVSQLHRSKLFHCTYFSPRSAIFVWCMNLTFSYGVSAVGLWLLHNGYGPTELGYCLLDIVLVQYAIMYAPAFYSCIAADSRFVRALELSEALQTSVLSPLLSEEDSERQSSDICDLLSSMNVQMIAFEDLQILDRIGSGGYGVVYSARWQGLPVAVKELFALPHLLRQGAASHKQAQELLEPSPLGGPQHQECEPLLGDADAAPNLDRPQDELAGSDSQTPSSQTKHQLPDDLSGVRELCREVYVLSRLRHPHCVQMWGLAVGAHSSGIVLEFMSRGSVHDVMHIEKHKLAWWQQVQALQHTAQAMMYLHSFNPPILHRDLKTKNLLVDDAWTVKVTDFGLATVKDLAETLTAIGTPAWSAPECLRHQQYSEKADVFSFGVTAWEIATQEVPFKGQRAVVIAHDVAFSGKRLAVPDAVPQGLADMMASCWAELPQERPSFEQLQTALDVLAAGGRGAAGQPSGGNGIQ